MDPVWTHKRGHTKETEREKKVRGRVERRREKK
jgi:hypothetical protein